MTKKLSQGRKYAMGATFLCSMLVLPVVPVLARRDEMPKIVIPAPKPLPKPNAFDFYVRAGKMRVKTPRDVYDRNPPLAVLQSAAKLNAPSLREVRRGFAFRYRTPPRRGPYVLSPPHWAGFRELARRLRTEARVLAARGNWNGAMNSHLDGLRFGSDIPRGGQFVGPLVGAAVEEIARSDADETVSHLSARQARAATKRMEALYGNRAALSENIREEKWHGLTVLKESFAAPNWRSQLDTMLGLTEDMTPLQKLRYKTLDANTVVKNYTTTMDAIETNSRLPYGAPLKPLPKNPDPFTAMMTESYVDPRTEIYFDLRWIVTRNEAANAMLLTALALRAFQAEKGRVPRSLQELVPSYLSRVPADAFGKGEALRYVRKGNREYVLYSIGPDGKDDGGKAPPKSDASSRLNPIQADSRGDVVFGINS